MLCSKLHYQKVFKLKVFSDEISRAILETRVVTAGETHLAGDPSRRVSAPGTVLNYYASC